MGQLSGPDRRRLYDGLWRPAADQLRPRRHLHGRRLRGLLHRHVSPRWVCAAAAGGSARLAGRPVDDPAVDGRDLTGRCDYRARGLSTAAQTRRATPLSGHNSPHVRAAAGIRQSGPARRARPPVPGVVRQGSLQRRWPQHYQHQAARHPPVGADDDCPHLPGAAHPLGHGHARHLL